MNIEIKDYCIRCGICVGLYPELFASNYEKDCIDVVCTSLSDELVEKARQAAADCAVTAIFVK